MTEAIRAGAIRPARAGDVPAIEAVVAEAYGPYAARIGREPGPMGDDYAGLVARGVVHVLEGAEGIDGLVVLVPEEDVLLLDNVAVRDAARGRGLGGRLLDFAEAEASRRGLGAVRLYAHELMVENRALYGRRGYRETHRAVEAGLSRVFMAKPLPGPRGAA